MGIRIHAQSIYTAAHPGFQDGGGYDAINDGMMRLYRTVLRPDTEVRPAFVDISTYYTSHIHLELLNNTELLRGIMRAEEEGFDVAFIRCGNDPVIHEAREAVAMPVVAMTQSAMGLACQLGARFALIGVDDKSSPIVERNLRLYGLEGRAIAVRPVRAPRADGWHEGLREAARWFTDTDYLMDKVVPAFEETARACIADGAEVIVTSCALYASLSLAGYRTIGGTDVPVVESVAAGIKNAEMLGDLYRSLGLTTSKHLTYQNHVPSEVRARLMAPFYPGAAG